MAENKPIKGYKVFDKDWRCREFQFTCPGVFEEDVIPRVCDRGFHFCEKLVDCFDYYPFDPKNHVAEVTALGDVETNGNKSCTNKIEIVREISWHEVLDLVNTGKNCTGGWNTGDWNTGDWNTGNGNTGNWNTGNRNSGNGNTGDWNTGGWNTGNWNTGNRNTGNGNTGNRNTGNWNTGDRNTGDWNSGDRNTGDWNSGDWNTGDWNSGDWNTGDWNSGNWNTGDWNKTNHSNGCFNTDEPKIYLFNKPSEWTYRDWLKSKARYLLSKIDYRILDWICIDNMTDEEKAAHPEAKTTGGYLKKLDTTKSAVTWWSGLSDDEKAVIKAIPNFDKEIFKEITGVDVDKEDADE